MIINLLKSWLNDLLGRSNTITRNGQTSRWDVVDVPVRGARLVVRFGKCTAYLNDGTIIRGLPADTKAYIEGAPTPFMRIGQ